ncbi:hypothetical protein K1719_018177 [Acacia pycnantha]|nr:hypothetical protein K1719_018177 [Acacia pycnantha]
MVCNYQFVSHRCRKTWLLIYTVSLELQNYYATSSEKVVSSFCAIRYNLEARIAQLGFRYSKLDRCL